MINSQDNQLSIYQKLYFFKIINNNHKLLNQLIKIIILLILFIFFYLIIQILLKNDIDAYDKKHTTLFNNFTRKYNNKPLSKQTYYQNLFPHLSPRCDDLISSIEEIFNAREIFISNNKITPEYIRYIRPINETKEIINIKPNFNKINESILDLTKKRENQYEYNEFYKLAFEQKLVNEKMIKYIDKPIISVVMPTYNKFDILLKSVRSVQNQILKNIEIIIVNDCSTDNSSIIFKYLLETDPRIRIFHHKENLGVFRSRLDGILYSRGKYIILFDIGDFYEDNYVLLDAFSIIEKYNFDSCRFFFREIKDLKKPNESIVYFHLNSTYKIAYKEKNIKALNVKVFRTWGNIWNRLVRANIYIKGLLLLNELTLNVYKNFWDDIWYNEIINKVSYSYVILNRIGYVYCNDGQGEGSPKFSNLKQKNRMIREYVAFLYFDYNFCFKYKCKQMVIKKLKEYNETNTRLNLKNFIEHFEVLNNFLEVLIRDKGIDQKNRKYFKELLKESKIREKKLNKIYN